MPNKQVQSYGWRSTFFFLRLISNLFVMKSILNGFKDCGS